MTDNPTDPRPDLDALADALADWRDTLDSLIEANDDANTIEHLRNVRRLIVKARRAVSEARQTMT